MAFVLKFVKNLRKKLISKVILFTENELKEAENYFFKKSNIGDKEISKAKTIWKDFN